MYAGLVLWNLPSLHSAFDFRLALWAVDNDRYVCPYWPTAVTVKGKYHAGAERLAVTVSDDG